MGILILGVIVGALSALLVFLESCLLYDEYSSRVATIIYNVITGIVCVVVLVMVPTGICYAAKMESRQYIESYVVTKQTIETSVKNEDLSGLERVQLVQTAIDENKELVRKQFDCKQWYGFTIDKGVLDLETINFD